MSVGNPSSSRWTPDLSGMAGNSFRRMFGGEPQRPPSNPGGADPALTAAYLDADRRFSSIDADVQTLEAQDPTALAVRQWPTVIGRFSAATDHYLWVSGAQPGSRPPGPPDIAACTRERVSGFTRSGLFNTRDTVINDTLASLATSFKDAIVFHYLNTFDQTKCCEQMRMSYSRHRNLRLGKSQ